MEQNMNAQEACGKVLIMRKFLIVLQYELKEYFGSKSFMVVTLMLAVLGALAMFLPRVFDMSDITGVQVVKEKEREEADAGEKDKMILFDKTGFMSTDMLSAYFANTEWIIADKEEQVTQAIESQEAEAGFVVKSLQEYDYYIYNRGMTDKNSYLFEEVMRENYRIAYCQEKGLDYQTIAQMYEVPVTVNQQILNKDTSESYWYCYVLVIVVFMLIVLYGQMIAVSVTNEKSNRAIEVLVTSTTSNSLLFGKVIAGAIGGLLQVGIIMGALLISYGINSSVWGGALDMILKIPTDVLIAFALFGLGGYLFYAFLYGAVGALVSKTEDVSKSSGGLMVIIMIVYMFSLMQLFNPEGMIIKILSFLPFSSYSTMFARMAMGTVSIWEIVLSFLILAASIFGAGALGARLYRMGTLRYGNPIKFTTALKDIRNLD